MTQYRKIKEAYIPDVTEGPTRKYALVHANDNGGRYYLSSYDVTLKKNSYKGESYTTMTTAIFENNDKRMKIDTGKWNQKKAASLATQWDTFVKEIDSMSTVLYEPEADPTTGLARLRSGEPLNWNLEEVY